jgi:hypothetical protein
MALVVRRREGKVKVIKQDIPEGVFIEGKPLEKYLEDDERDQKSKEVEEVRSEFIKKSRKTHGTYADERQQPDTRKVSKRTRWFTDSEIRKEYGIMEKPFEGNAENAIWVILQKGPLTVKGIGEQMQWHGKGNTLSALVATVWTRLGNMHNGAAKILDREKDPHSTAHRYFKAEGIDISPEAAIEQYKLIGAKQHQMKRAATRGEEYKEEAPKKTRRIVGSKLHPIHNNETKEPANLTKVIEQVIETTLGIKVEVSGHVEVIFKFGG